MIKSLKISLIYIISLSSFNVSTQECDLKCQMDSIYGNKPDKQASASTRSNNRYSSLKPLIYDKDEVQDFFDQITSYYTDEALAVKIGFVSGDLNNFNIGNIKIQEDGETLFEIEEISYTDDDRLGFGNRRPSSVKDLVSYDYYSEWIEDGGLVGNFEFNIEGINLSSEISDGLYYEVPYLRNLGLTEDIRLLSSQTSDYRNVEAEFLIDMNDQLKFLVKVEQPKSEIEESMLGIEEVFELFSYAAYEGSCESDYDDLLYDAGLSEDEYPRAVFVIDYFQCLINGFYYIDDDVFISVFDTLDNASADFTGMTSFDVSWSSGVWNAASIASGGALDVGLLTAKGFLANKMSKFELLSLLDGVFQIPYEYRGLFDDLVYDYYSDFYDEAKTFVNYPRGIGISVEILNPIDPNIIENIEDNPMLFFNILNNIRFDIYANPGI